MLISHKVGDIDNNLNRADAVLSKANPQDLDLLVLPELAFSGEFKAAQPTWPKLMQGGNATSIQTSGTHPVHQAIHSPAYYTS